MLAKAVDKVRAAPLPHVRGVAAMDACRLGFPDARFDAVTMPFVITLVPDPEGALDECARVLRPGGALVISSKFGQDDGLVARLEHAVAPLMKRIGWSSAFKISRVEAWAKRRGDMEMRRDRAALPGRVLQADAAAQDRMSRRLVPSEGFRGIVPPMTERVKRRLTTVLCADVEGYSRLMEADEAGTLATLRRSSRRHDGAGRAPRRPRSSTPGATW